MQIERATTTPTSPVVSGKAAITPSPTASGTANTTVSTPLTGGQLTSGSALQSDTNWPDTVEANASAVAAAYAHRMEPDEELAARVDRETQKLADTLMERLRDKHIPTDEPLRLRVDSSGTVHAEGPFKEKIEKLFTEDRELAKQFKDMAGLNALVALNKLTRLHHEELKQARNDDERQEARDRYTARSVQLQKVSGTMILAGGQLFSAARGFADSLSAA
ncbi:MAG: hypothetical protein H7Y60_12805 [Rhodospirillaceae bacterium]|nr:hypothetical protein [Rhodospirillales bacterium]